jgi:hypothetical protein
MKAMDENPHKSPEKGAIRRSASLRHWLALSWRILSMLVSGVLVAAMLIGVLILLALVIF